MGSDPLRMAEADVDDTQRFARMSPEERLALFLQLCDLTDSVQAGRPDRDRLRRQQRRSEEALALWGRLMRDASHGR